MAPEAAVGFISASSLPGAVALPARRVPTCAEIVRCNSVVTTGGKTIPNFCCKKHPSVADDAPMCGTRSLPLMLLSQTAVSTVAHAVFHAAENKRRMSVVESVSIAKEIGARVTGYESLDENVSKYRQGN